LTLPGGVDLSRLSLSIDWRVLATALAITLLTLALAAWLPIASFTRERLAGELIGTTATTSASWHRLRQALLAVHVGATIVVLVAAGLFVRAAQHGFSAGAGFDVDRTLFVHLQLVPPFVADSTDMDARDALIPSSLELRRAGPRGRPDWGGGKPRPYATQVNTGANGIAQSEAGRGIAGAAGRRDRGDRSRSGGARPGERGRRATSGLRE
jgi:hypothetical protein